MRTFILLNVLAISTLLHAQELKKITKANNKLGEIYYVLKDNKSIKHGQYLKYHESMDLYNKAIESYGAYDHNKKTGVWLYCNVNHRMNPLIAIGEYKDDKKDGQWIYFYSPVLKDTSAFSILGYKKLTKVILPTKGNEQFQVTLDTAGTKIASIGNFSNNIKTGIWNYYSQNGSLVYKFDFSNHQLIFTNGSKSSDQLGGINRFKELVHQSFTEYPKDPFFYRNSKVTLEITTYNDSLTIARVNTIGCEGFAKTMENIIQRMSLEWINYDPILEQNKIRIYINYVVNDNIGTAMIDSVIPLSKLLMLNKN
jgi:antitoxin component YwqK of YwqJK toxin-antitoxin module